MISGIGQFLILASLLASAAGAVLAFVVGRNRSAFGLQLARGFAYAYSGLIIGAGLLMVYALLIHDFSVSYVAKVGSRAVPTWVTIVSLWSSLEGSILFWGLVLGLYIAVATYVIRGKYEEYQADAIAVWLASAAFFSFLLAAPSNPFTLVQNPPLDGPGPNALLQNHILMAVHPPFLYLGYVGFTIPFGFACAALMRGRLGHNVLKPLRESLMLPWIFQSVAIMLGGWWAYEVLGWGGYWAWDPVENASLLPWLTATAALHSIMVVERRGILKGWTVTLIQSTFLLVILGTFMTRSGVFNSVHSFTTSDVGKTILIFLGVALVYSVVLLSLRIDKLEPEGRIEGAASREATFLLNNLIFVLLTFTVLIGTVFPLIVEAVQGKQMSVGRPYFDSMTVPLGALLLFLLGVGPALPWGRATAAQVKKALIPPVLGAVALAAIGYGLGARTPWTLLTLAFGGYAAYVTLVQMFLPMLQRMRSGQSLGSALVDGQLRRGRRRFASYIVHAAVVLTIIAIAVSSSMRTQTELHFSRKGETLRGAGYDVTFNGIEQRAEPHRFSTIGAFTVSKDGKPLGELKPRMNQYQTMAEPIGTPAVHTTAVRDVYLSLSNVDPAAGTASITLYVAPMVVWIWLAVIAMAVGALFGLIPARQRRAAATVDEPVVGAPETA